MWCVLTRLREVVRKKEDRTSLGPEVPLTLMRGTRQWRQPRSPIRCAARIRLPLLCSAKGSQTIRQTVSLVYSMRWWTWQLGSSRTLHQRGGREEGISKRAGDGCTALSCVSPWPHEGRAQPAAPACVRDQHDQLRAWLLACNVCQHCLLVLLSGSPRTWTLTAGRAGRGCVLESLDAARRKACWDWGGWALGSVHGVRAFWSDG